MLNSNAAKIKTYVGSDGKIHFVDSAGADTALNFSSGGVVNSVTGISEGYTGSSISTTVTNGKIYMIIAGLRWVTDGNVTFSGGTILHNSSRGALSKGMSWWHTIYTTIIKATSTTLKTTYSTHDADYNTYSIYLLS